MSAGLSEHSSPRTNRPARNGVADLKLPVAEVVGGTSPAAWAIHASTCSSTPWPGHRPLRSRSARLTNDRLTGRLLPVSRSAAAFNAFLPLLAWHPRHAAHERPGPADPVRGYAGDRPVGEPASMFAGAGPGSSTSSAT